MVGGSGEEVLCYLWYGVQDSPKQGIGSLVSILAPSFSSVATYVVTNTGMNLDRE